MNNFFVGSNNKMNGLQNTGNHCYFNSLVQALINLPPFRKYIENNNNEITQLFGDIINNKVDNILSIKAALKRHNIKNKNKLLSDHGQECSRETFDLLMDYFESVDPSICQIFEMRRQTVKRCDKCDTKKDALIDPIEYSFECYEDEPVDNSNNSLNNNLHYIERVFFRGQSIPEGYNCETCGGQLVKQRILARVNDVIMFTFPKFPQIQRKISMHDFPIRPIRIKMRDGTYNEYMPTSMVLHSGGPNGGHYMAMVRRKDKAYLFNDAHVAAFEPEKFTIQPNTFMLFYVINKLH